MVSTSGYAEALIIKLSDNWIKQKNSSWLSKLKSGFGTNKVSAKNLNLCGKPEASFRRLRAHGRLHPGQETQPTLHVLGQRKEPRGTGI